MSGAALPTRWGSLRFAQDDRVTGDERLEEMTGRGHDWLLGGCRRRASDELVDYCAQG